MPTYPNSATALTILNNVADEMAIDISTSDPYSGSLEGDRQLRALLSTAGRELLSMYDWQILRKVYEFTTTPTDTGNYALPTDWSRIMNQSGWDTSEELPLYGPLSPQQWSTLVSRAVVSTTTLGFRITGGEILIYPYNPVGVTRTLRFEYVSNTWVLADDGITFKTAPNSPSDLILYDQTLTEKLLKYKWLQAKGFDATAAWQDFQDRYDALTGQEKGATILSTNCTGGGFPLINAWRNTSDTNFGG